MSEAPTSLSICALTSGTELGMYGYTLPGSPIATSCRFDPASIGGSCRMETRPAALAASAVDRGFRR